MNNKYTTSYAVRVIIVFLIIGLIAVGIMLSLRVVTMRLPDKMRGHSRFAHADKVRAIKSQLAIEVTPLISAIEAYFSSNGRYPDSLSELSNDHLDDAWTSPSIGLKVWKYYKLSNGGYQIIVPDSNSHADYPCYIYDSKTATWLYDA